MARLGRAQPFPWKQQRPKLAAGVSVTPSTATLTLTGFAPTVATPRLVTPGTKALTLTTFAPTVATPRLVTPSTLALTLTGYAPTVATPVAVTPSTVALVLTGFAPAVSVGSGSDITPDTLALTLTGYAPDVTVAAAPGADTRTLSGIPSIRKRRRPVVYEAQGRGLVLVSGMATATREICARAELLQDVDAQGQLVRERFQVLEATIRSGAEAIAARESALLCDAVVMSVGSGAGCADRRISGAGAQSVMQFARMATETAVRGGLPVRAGGEAVLHQQESDEVVILAAGMMLARRLR